MLGLAARLGKLCTLGMIEDVHYGQDYGRLWMWLTALGTAMILNFGAEALGFIDLSATCSSNRYSILGAIVGGLSVRLRHGAGRQLRLRRARAARRRGHPRPDDRHRDGRHGQRGLFGVLGGCARRFFPMDHPVGTRAIRPRPFAIEG
jgi:hypothetical protein